jgi:hypothetical protein
MSTVWTSSPTVGSTSDSHGIDFDLGNSKIVKDFSIYFPDDMVGGTAWIIKSANSDPTCTFTGTDSLTPYTSLIGKNSLVILTGVTGYIGDPVRCFRILVKALPAGVTDISIKEVVVRLAEPSVEAVVVSSTLSDPNNALDISATTESIAPLSAGTSHHIMFDLNSPVSSIPGHSPDVWGMAIQFNSQNQLDQSSIRLYICDPAVGSNTLSDCINQPEGRSVDVVYNRVTQNSGFQFGPFACTGCTRVAITMHAISGATDTVLFSIKKLSVFASYNQALIPGTSVSLAPGDTRGWDYWTSKAVDGDGSTYWLAEPDATYAEYTVSLIPEKPGFDPLSSLPPTGPKIHTKSISVTFTNPVVEYIIESSVDGSAYTQVAHVTNAAGTISGTFNILSYVYFVRVKILSGLQSQTSPLSLTSPDQTKGWYVPLLGISTISVMTMTNLATDPTPATLTETAGLTATNTVDPSTTYSINSGLWLSMPSVDPSVKTTGLFWVVNKPVGGGYPSTGIDISAIKLRWYIGSIYAQVSIVSPVTGFKTLLPPTAWISDNSSPLMAKTYLTFTQNVVALSITLTDYESVNNFQVTVFKDMEVYSPNRSAQMSVSSITSVQANPNINALLYDNDLTTYWVTPTSYSAPAWITLTLADPTKYVGTIEIFWYTVCQIFSIMGDSETIYSTSTNNADKTEIQLFRKFTSITIQMIQNVGRDINVYPTQVFQIKEIALYEAELITLKLKEQVSGDIVNFDVNNAVDFDTAIFASSGDIVPNTRTMWMVYPTASSPGSPSSLLLRLNEMKKISQIQIFWAVTVWDSSTINNINNLRQYMIFTNADCSDTLSSDYTYITQLFTTTGNTDLYVGAKEFRCFKILIKAGSPALGGNVLGPAIRDISMTLDRNIVQVHGGISQLL